ncbi:MAG: hypothetical protein KatS3mg105_1951 [Gemmatales bacterium]|nr:MAG: hypothetical protein KatS3mg105_1951 [Gemmatales bacterium]
MCKRQGRREFLARSVLLAGTSEWLSSAILADDVLERRKPVGLKISCSSLAFSDMPWDKALAAIKKLGFRYADLAMFEGWTHVSPSQLTEPEKLGKKIAEVCEKLAIEPIAIHANFRPSKDKKFPGLTASELKYRRAIWEHFGRVLACARAASIPLINVQPGKFFAELPRQVCLDNAANVMRVMVRQADQHDIQVSFENHTGSVAEKPHDALYLLEKVDGLRLDLDFSHVVANSIPLKETLPLLKYVSHVGVRNAKAGDFNVPLAADGEMNYPLGDFISALRQARVKAFVSVEYFEPKKRDSIPPLKKALEKLGLSSQ